MKTTDLLAAHYNLLATHRLLKQEFNCKNKNCANCAEFARSYSGILPQKQINQGVLWYKRALNDVAAIAIRDLKQEIKELKQQLTK